MGKAELLNKQQLRDANQNELVPSDRWYQIHTKWYHKASERSQPKQISRASQSWTTVMIGTGKRHCYSWSSASHWIQEKSMRFGVLQAWLSRNGRNTRLKTRDPYHLSFCKIMEHVIVSKLMNHGEQNNILYPLQHGFKRGRSCERQLIDLLMTYEKKVYRTTSRHISSSWTLPSLLTKFVIASWSSSSTTME